MWICLVEVFVGDDCVHAILYIFANVANAAPTRSNFTYN